jgi:16S rRNA (cytosine967-C5)-methyltransferase
MTETDTTTDIRTLYQGARGTAIKVLNRIERTDSYLDKLLDSELKSNGIADVDKSLFAEIVHGVIRWQGRLDWVLNGFTHGNFAKSEVNVKNALRVALYQLFFLNQVPQYAAVNEAVEFIKRIRGEKLANFVNGVLRNIIRNIENIHYPKPEDDPVQYLAVYYSHPYWLVKRWVDRFGREEVEKLLPANNEVPNLTLRINKLKIAPGEFLGLLDAQSISYQGSALIDRFIKVRSLSGIAQMNIFQNGYFSIQDESAALPVLLLAPKPGERIIDLCAAPGGKTTFIAEMMENKGEILAVDKYETKLKMITTSCDRLGISIAKPMIGDAVEIQIESADGVLVDVPCSGLGVLRKKPDIKWKRQPEDIPHLAKFQSKILANAATLVKPGGALVYSTCTTEPEENELVVQGFLKNHPEYTIDHASKFVNKAVVREDGSIATFPHRDRIDGSFAVRLIRSS